MGPVVVSVDGGGGGCFVSSCGWCSMFFLNNRDVTRMRFWIITFFKLFCFLGSRDHISSSSFVSCESLINVAAVVVRTKNIGLRIRRELCRRVENAEKKTKGEVGTDHD